MSNPVISTLYKTTVGTLINASGSNLTIAPVASVTHVTGTGSVQTITLPVTGFVGAITLLPNAAFTTVTGGNIALASTAVVNKALIMVYDGTSWKPSY